MHSPQRMQVRKNSVSGIAPGGRISWNLLCLMLKGVWVATNPTASPPAREETNPRREKSTFEYSPPIEREAGKVIAFCGHTLAHVRHWVHSGRRVPLGSSATAPMGQAFWHFRHSLQSSLTRRLKSPRGEIKLRKAPNGHR